MRIKFFLFLGVFAAWFNSGWAQSEKFQAHGGLTFQYFTFQNRVGAFNATYFYGINGGVNYVLMHSNDQVSLSLDGNVNFSFSFVTTDLLLQVPVYLAVHAGAGSTPSNESKIGIGAGIGGAFTYFNFFTGNGFTRVGQAFGGSSAMVEVLLRTSFSDYILRVNFTPIRTSTRVMGDDIYLGNFGASLLYLF